MGQAIMHNEAMKTVLIVDDSPIVLDATRMALEERGYGVMTTSSPMEVPTLIRRHRPNLVLLDVSMPVLSGDRVVRVFRSFGNVPETKIVLFSDRSVGELGRLVSVCAADGFIQKTGDFDELARRIDEYF